MTESAVVRWLDGPLANIIWKGMALIALVLSVAIGVRQFQMTQCQARYNEASNVSQRARSEAAEQDRQAQDAMFKAIAKDPKSTIVLLNGYLEDRAAANAQRAQNPVPPPPSETCG